mgnify:CR=1 FL=1
MPFTSEQLTYGGRAAIDYFLKNDPIDQVNTDRPLIKKLMEEKSEYAGGLQYVTEQLRYQNDSNFQSYFGSQQVSYNRKRTLQQAKFTWGSFHDGFGLDEDELAQNGITMTDDKSSTPTDAEKVQLTNLMKENAETLKLGFQENFDLMLHRDGSASATDIPGLDALIDLTPATGTVGTIDASTATWWRNFASLDIADADLIDQMELAWRRCIRVGGSAPNFILVGSAFLDKYRQLAGDTVNRQVMDKGKGGVNLDASVSGVFFKGVELIWDPVFETLDTLDAPAQAWEKRCYFINTRFMKLRPIKGHWLVNRKPPRVYDRYVHYFALTAKAALTTGKRNAHAVLTID